MVPLHLLLFFFLRPPAFADGLGPPYCKGLESFAAQANSLVRVIFLDADQTVRVTNTQWRAPWHPKDVEILPGVPEKIAQLSAQGYLIAIVSNQQNAATGVGIPMLKKIMDETMGQMETAGGRVNCYDFGLDATDAKPAPAMFHRLEKKLQDSLGAKTQIDKAHSLMSGDSAYLAPSPKTPGELRPDGPMAKTATLPGLDDVNYDRMFAENSGIPFEEPQYLFNWKKYGIDRFRNYADLVAFRAAHQAVVPFRSSCAKAFAALTLPAPKR